ncbi:hypothetical protein ACR9E3_04650 [Actinomycetospora sp. C-140]
MVDIPAAEWLFQPRRSCRVARILRADDRDAAVRADAVAEFLGLRWPVEYAARRIGRVVVRHTVDGERLVHLESEVDALPERVQALQQRFSGTPTAVVAAAGPVVAWGVRRLRVLERAQDTARTRRRRRRVSARLRVQRAERAAAWGRLRHEEVVLRARAAGARDAKPAGEVVDDAVTPLRELLTHLDRCP